VKGREFDSKPKRPPAAAVVREGCAPTTGFVGMDLYTYVSGTPPT
jgi:hypothetical protein